VRRIVTATDDGATIQRQFEVIDFLVRFSRLIERGRTILDAGCGNGLPADAYLVEQGFAVNGIDASARMIELARKNVPEGFYEVKNLIDLQEGEYCVDGVVSLRAMLQIPRANYHAVLTNFASFMPSGGALLLAMAPRQREGIDTDPHNATAPWTHDGVESNAEIIEHAGFSIIADGTDRSGDEMYQIILARS